MEIEIQPSPPYMPFPRMGWENDIANLGFNMPTIFYSWIIIGVLTLVSFLVYRKLRPRPGRLKGLSEGPGSVDRWLRRGAARVLR